MIIKKSDGSVTFEFDQNTSHKVYIAGDFNNWNYSATPLKKTPKGKYSITLNLKPGKYQFRYFTDHNWYNDSAADGYENNNYGSENSVVMVDNCCCETTTGRTTRTTAGRSTGTTTRSTTRTTGRATKDNSHNRH